MIDHPYPHGGGLSPLGLALLIFVGASLTYLFWRGVFGLVSVVL